MSATTVTVKPKAWYASRTLQVNVLSLVLVAAGFIAENTGILSLPSAVAPWALLVLTLANAGLRLVTSSPIQGTPAADPPASAAETSG